MQPSAVDPLVGRTLEGRYRLLERIARGGMSTVYAAVDERLDRSVAVKVMSSALSADPAFSDRFAREARAAARLTHLNTVAVYDQGREVAPDGHHVFLVMELVEGRTLRELLREKHRLSPAEAVSLMEPVLSALAAAHRAGIAHRDVKPENILLSDDGVVKVADFGLARAVESDAASTRTGLMMGTVAYCAPEQFTQGVADQRSDVYACGIVMFELLTGQPPFKGDTAINVAYQHVNSRVPAPSSRVKGIPVEIDELVVHATDSDPESRPADAGELLAEVADVRDELELPVMPVPPRTRQRVRHLQKAPAGPASPDGIATDFIGRRPVGVANQLTAIVPQPGAVGGRALLAPAPEEVPPPPVVIPPPKRRRGLGRRRRALIIVLILLLLGAAVGWGTWYYVSGRYSRIPDVIGTSQAAAVDALHKAGYDDVKVQPAPQFDDRPADVRIPAGKVLTITPSAGSRVVKSKLVSIVMSYGPRKFTLPPVGDEVRPQQEVATLRQLSSLISVSPTIQAETSETVPAGYVTRLDPKVGSVITRDNVVTIWISKGPPYVTVPTVPDRHTSVADMKRLLTGVGLRSTEGDAQYSSTVPNGDVIAVSPSTRAQKHSLVTITPSKGHAPVTVPNLTADTPFEAHDALQALGFDARYTRDTLFGETYLGVTSPDYAANEEDVTGQSLPYGATVFVHFGM